MNGKADRRDHLFQAICVKKGTSEVTSASRSDLRVYFWHCGTEGVLLLNNEDMRRGT